MKRGRNESRSDCGERAGPAAVDQRHDRDKAKQAYRKCKRDSPSVMAPVINDEFRCERSKDG
jgi:hypothetical protein